MGHFGSLVFFGLASGSVYATLIVGKIPWKFILQSSFLGNGVGLFIFGYSSNYYVVCFGRWFSGFNQIFLIIYMPLYIDAFANHNQKAAWMSSILLAPPVGVLIGYGLTATTVGVYDDWRISFII